MLYRSRFLRSLRPFCYTALMLGLVLQTSACLKRVRTQLTSINQYANDQRSAEPPLPTQTRININTASANELETLPGIGKSLAQRIIEHRERFGRFRRPEHLIIVRGISDKRFRALQDLITVQ